LQAADKLRENMDSSEYKHNILVSNFLKYISNSFEKSRAEVSAELRRKDILMKNF